jgi:hypothetical protein
LGVVKAVQVMEVRKPLAPREDQVVVEETVQWLVVVEHPAKATMVGLVVIMAHHLTHLVVVAEVKVL